MAKITIQPLFDNVLIKPLQSDTTTPSGIVLPDSVKEKPQIGQVMAVGLGSDCGDDCGCDDHGGHGGCHCGSCGSKKIVVKVGQKVMYKKWGGNEVKVGNEEWMIVEQKDILAVVE